MIEGDVGQRDKGNTSLSLRCIERQERPIDDKTDRRGDRWRAKERNMWTR